MTAETAASQSRVSGRSAMPDVGYPSPQDPILPLSCLGPILQRHAERRPHAPAIFAPGRNALTYSALYEHIDKVGRKLRAAGIGRRDRVAIVMPNGPEMAVAILAVAAHAVCAPINPAYGAEELDRYIAVLRTRALITLAGFASPARAAAQGRGLPVLELSTEQHAQAGLFAITGGRSDPVPEEPASPSDLALLFLTSGTTSQPKIVRLTHASICAAAYITGSALALQETDRCLNVMPLFHGHGLIGAVLSSLVAGASVVCTAGCDVNRFFDWLSEYQPTWYSAVPTMHQAIVAAARRQPGGSVQGRLRFVRSASAPLPPRVVAELEATFATCAIDTYAMMEASSAPVACHPLPPGERKTGSVGVPVGLDVAIMDSEEVLLPAGQTGEIVIRGATVMDGYDGDDAATQRAFAGGWLKTGDLGYFDSGGHLFLTGRAKEIINRGGEKIAPREIDEALLEHPAVAEAVAFAVPHSTLGEDVAAAIVLQPGAAVTSQDIRQFAAGRLAEFKIPQQLLFVVEIPKGPTGKLQRIGLAAKLGLDGLAQRQQGFVAPRTKLEKVLAESWAEILRVEHVGIHDSFFALGGDSLSAVHALAHIYSATRRELEVSRFFEAPTIAEIANHLEAMTEGDHAAAITRAVQEDGVPASAVQEQLCELQRRLPGLPFFNLLYTLRLTSAFDAAILEQSFNEIVRRHAILRTTLAAVDGRYLQIVAPQLTVRPSFDDLRSLPESERETVGQQIIREELLHSFDLASGPLLRLRLIRLGDMEHLLLINTHQVVADGWSFGVLVEELLALYQAISAGKQSSLMPLPIQYGDFAQWQRSWRSHPEIVEQLAYWREQLRDPLPAMELVASPRRHAIDGLLTARRELAFSASLSDAAKSFSQREGGTLFTALIAALKALLQRYLRQDDLRVATLVANRNRPGAEALIGPLVNTVILRTNLGGDPSTRELMQRIRTTTLEAFAHQDLPFEELVEALGRERGIKAAAMSRVIVSLHNASLRPVSSESSLSLEEAYPNMLLPLVSATTFDITLVAHETANSLNVTCIYKPSMFDSLTVDGLLEDLQLVLEQMVANPDQPISMIQFPSSQKQLDPPLCC